MPITHAMKAKNIIDIIPRERIIVITETTISVNVSLIAIESVEVIIIPFLRSDYKFLN